MSRDMTKAEFLAACKRAGFTRRGFLGYYALPCGVEVSVCNTGSKRRRDWLAYLHQMQAKHEKRKASAT